MLHFINKIRWIFLSQAFNFYHGDGHGYRIPIHHQFVLQFARSPAEAHSRFSIGWNIESNFLLVPFDKIFFSLRMFFRSD